MDLITHKKCHRINIIIYNLFIYTFFFFFVVNSKKLSLRKKKIYIYIYIKHINVYKSLYKNIKFS